MSDLSPILTPTHEPYHYAARDYIGVDARAPLAPRGINASTAWTRLVTDVLGVEHGLGGTHETLKIPRAKIHVFPVGPAANREISSLSYIGAQMGQHVATVAQIGPPYASVAVTFHFPVGAQWAALAVAANAIALRRQGIAVHSFSSSGCVVQSNGEFVLYGFW